VRLLALFALASLIVTLVVLRWPKPRPQTAIAKAAENATPEIAALLREINDVACNTVRHSYCYDVIAVGRGAREAGRIAGQENRGR
jgi:hypothetical protein